MAIERVSATKLRVGDVIEVWWSPNKDRIRAIRPYTGPYDFVEAVADFVLNPTGMSLIKGEFYNRVTE
jgi:hypothetical protein